MEELSPHLMTIFNALALNTPGNALSLTDEDTTLPQDVVEGILMAHLDLTPEQIREVCADSYDAETGTYTHAFGLGGGPAYYYITASEKKDGVLTLSYDSYGGDYEGTYEEFHYALTDRGVLEIAVDGDNFRFLSNRVQAVPELG